MATAVAPAVHGGSKVAAIFLDLLLPAAFARAPDDDVEGVAVAAAEVVVEGSAVDPASTSASLTVLPLGAELPPAEDLASVVDLATGTTVRRLGGLGDYATVSIRGSSTRQVEVFLDGIPLNPDGGATVDLSELPVSSFARAELYRGFAPIGYGTSAIGGVVNLVTPPQGVATTLGGAAGSWGTERTFGVVAPQTRAADLLLAVEQFHTRGDFRYFDDQGTEYNLLDDRTSVRANNRIDRGGVIGRVDVGPIRILDTAATLSQQLPGSISSPSDDATLDSFRNLLVAQADLSPGDQWRVVPRAWWLTRTQTTFDPYGDLGVGPSWTTDRFQTAGAHLGVTWVPTATLAADGLLRSRAETYRPFDHYADAEDGTRLRWSTVGALGATWMAWGERLSFNPILQAELLDDRFLGEVPFEDAPVSPEAATLALYGAPRVGVLFRPVREVSLKANTGLYTRPPDLTELFGQAGSIVGNTDLVPERGFTVDVGAHLAAPPIWPIQGTLDLGYARTQARDLIVLVQNSQQTSKAENIAEAYTRSVEGALAVDVAGWVRSATALTWTLSRNLSTDPTYANNQLPGISPVELSQTTTVDVRRYVSLSHTWTWTDATWSDPANTVRLAPRSLHAVALAVTPGRGLPSLSVEVLNLTDALGMAVDRNFYSDTDNTLVVKPITDFAGFPLPGRTVMVAVTWQEQPKEPS